MTKDIWSQERRPRSQENIHHQNGSDAPDPAVGGDVPAQENTHNLNRSGATRSLFQQDYDRLLFSTPVRRLADKTQVWPMDQNDGVRSRLTHSHEVANLARSIGAKVLFDDNVKKHFVDKDKKQVSLPDVIQPILLAISLGHDLGNPPFGHQGEAAIGNWFKKRQSTIFSPEKKWFDRNESIPRKYYSEFTEFDGNPQSLRLLTKLQTHIDGVGLDLTATTLAASLKYPVSFQNKNKENSSIKKGGYFESEKEIITWIREKTGLEEGQRHPLTWIMEACDDIAYSILDIDDVLKKRMMSPDDVLTILLRDFENVDVVKNIQIKFKNVEAKSLTPPIQEDIKIQYLRALLIESLIKHASNEYINNVISIFEYEYKSGLMENSAICKRLKVIARENAFNHATVLRSEAIGASAIDGLMTAFWEAISNRKNPNDIRSNRNSARTKYIFSLISPNYIDIAMKEKDNPSEIAKNMRYRELRLLTDMVSGMTDSFALRIWENIKSIPL